MGGGNSDLISFTIDGTSYQAEEGMTWSEWVNSSYNTGGYTLVESTTAEDTYYVLDISGSYIVANKTGSQSWELQQSNNTIEDNVAYTHYQYAVWM